MNVSIVDGVAQPGSSLVGPAAAAPSAQSFGEVLAGAIGSAAEALHGADAQAGLLAAGGDDVMDASIARAKADVALEVVSVAASRVSGAVNSLLQTQV